MTVFQSIRRRFFSQHLDLEDIHAWREHVLSIVLRVVVILGSVVAVPSILLALSERLWSVIIVDVIALAWLVMIWRIPFLSYRTRAWHFCALLYLLGSALLFTVGPTRQTYLMAFPMMTALLLGLRPAVFALVLNAVTLLAVGYLANANLNVAGFEADPLLKWLVITINFTFVNSMITISSAVLLHGLEKTLQSRRDSEELYRATFDNAPVGVAHLAPDGRWLRVNSKLCEITGYSRDELLGCTYRDITHPEDYASGIAGIGALILGQIASVDMEKRYIRKDGLATWISLRISVVRGASGEAKFLVSVAADISERKRTEQALLESEERHRLLFESSRDALMTLAPPLWRFTNANHATLKLFRAPSASAFTELDPRKVSPERQPDGRPSDEKAQEAIASAMREGECAFEWEHRRLDGSLFPADVLLTRMDLGAEVFLQATVRDLTERKRADQALRDSEKRLSAIFRASPIGVSVIRLADARILEANDAALRLYRAARDDVIGRTVNELGIYVDPAQRVDLLTRLRGQGQVEHIEIDFRNSSGALGKLELTGRVIELQGDQCLVAMMVDITGRKRLEEAHLQAQKLESLGTLAGGIAHDFNNILTAIRGNADLARQDLGPDHKAAESLEEITKAGARASELVRRITAFGRPKEARQEAVDLSAVLAEVLKLLRSTLPAGISLRREFAGDCPHVLADAGQIHEAIVNLTTNAAYAIGTGAGLIAYRLEPVQVGEALARSIPGLKQGRYARLSVSDSGCGMDAATLERIFDAFYTTKPVGEGTGLGLSMVHGTMRSLGGAVMVESTPGKGSSFALYFPATEEQAQKEEQAAPVQIHLTAGQRVLYVDDEEALVILASRALSRLGHKVSSFTDPEEALEAFRAHPQDFDVMVTDLSMPHMSGLELAREVLTARPGMPVLVTTGYLRAADEDKARAIGIRAFILKPATMDELGQMLDRLVRDSR